jgi:hypothetical protein
LSSRRLLKLSSLYWQLFAESKCPYFLRSEQARSSLPPTSLFDKATEHRPATANRLQEQAEFPNRSGAKVYPVAVELLEAKE